MGRIDVVCWVLAVVMLAVTAEGKVHKVGDDLGWAIGGPDYTAWASSNVFHVGDTLLFEYMPGSHNVLEVSKQDYVDCNTESPIQTLSSGSDSIVIKKAGTFYYICGIPTHCPIGQKVEIRALTSNTSGSPPTPTPVSPAGGPPPSLPPPVSPAGGPPPSLPPPVSPAGAPPSVPPTGGPPPSLPPTVSSGPSDGPPSISPGPPPVSPGPTMNGVAPPPEGSAAYCRIVDGGMGWLALVIAAAIACCYVN